MHLFLNTYFMLKTYLAFDVWKEIMELDEDDMKRDQSIIQQARRCWHVPPGVKPIFMNAYAWIK